MCYRLIVLLIATQYVVLATLQNEAAAVQDADERHKQWLLATTSSTENSQRGLSWLMFEGERGDARSALAVGKIFDKGLNRPRDPGQARRWYTRAAEAGSQDARLQLLRLRLLEARAVDDVQAILKDVQDLASDSVDAQAIVGWCIEYGLLGSDLTDTRRSVVKNWLCQIIDSPPDRRVLVESYWYMRRELNPGPREFIAPLPPDALRWYLQAGEAESGGSAWGALKAARHLSTNGTKDEDKHRAAKLISSHISTCDPVLLPTFYLFLSSEGVLLPDAAEHTRDCLRRSARTLPEMANRGDAYACQMHAFLINATVQDYPFGEKISDVPTAVELSWYQKAIAFRMLGAFRGDPIDQLIVAEHLFAGEHVTRDVDGATHWWAKSAAAGNPIAQFRLGQCYKVGEGVPRDEKNAAMWLAKAQVQGITRASQVPKLH